MNRGAFIGLAAMLAACEARTPAADSTAAAGVDTAQPVVVNAAADSARLADSMRVTDSVARAATKAAPAPARTGTTTPATRAKADSVKLNPNIGRDSVIRRPRPFPAADTTKRP
jgi:hypothetical protein